MEETKTISGEYRENTTIYEVTVAKDGVTIKDGEGNVISKEDSVTIKNHLKQGEAEISKQDITGEEELSGATLNVKGEDVDITWVSTNEPKKLHLKDGEYTLTEIFPNDGYQLNTEVITFVVKDGETTKVVMHNKKIPQEVKNGKLPQAGDTLTGILLVTGTGLLLVGAVLHVIRRKKNKEV